MQFMSEEYVKHALTVIERVLERLDAARKAQNERIARAKRDIATIDEHLPAAILQSLVTGDRERVNALHHLRMLSEQELADADLVLNGRAEDEGYVGVNGVGREAADRGRMIGSPIDRYELQGMKWRNFITDRISLDMIREKGDPLTWWPSWLTAPEPGETLPAHAIRGNPPVKVREIPVVEDGSDVDLRAETRRMLAEGVSQAETARRLGLSRRTVGRYAGAS